MPSKISYIGNAIPIKFYDPEQTVSSDKLHYKITHKDMHNLIKLLESMQSDIADLKFARGQGW